MLISDLPVAPVGCEWKQHKPDVCLLYRDGKQVGKVAVVKRETAYQRVGGPLCSLDGVDVRLAAYDLFGQCGLMTQDEVAQALATK